MSPIPPSSPAAAPATVFIVDDEPQMTALFANILNAAGYRCETFESAHAFLRRFDINASGCILLDINMPDMDGPKLQEVLLERGCRMPILFLTAKTQVSIAVSVLVRGAITLIEKPCSHQVLIQAVQDALEIDRARRARVLEIAELRKCISQLTSREHQVAQFLANGMSNKQIAAALGLSPRTIEIHRSRIMAKMACESIVDVGLKWHKLQDAQKAADQRTPDSLLPAKKK